MPSSFQALWPIAFLRFFCYTPCMKNKLYSMTTDQAKQEIIRLQQTNKELLDVLDEMVKAFITNSMEIMDRSQCDAETLAMQALNRAGRGLV